MRQGSVPALCLWAAVCWMPVPSQSQSSSILPDPTRPPVGVSTAARTDASPVVEGAPVREAVRAASAPRAASSGPPRPRLTLIRLDVNGEGVALIDGRLMSIGDRTGDAVLASIDAQGVVLRGPKGWQRLPLIAPVASLAAVKPGAAAPERDEKESP